MAGENLERVTAKIFAENAPDGMIGQFGSALTGAKVPTGDVSVIQNLPAYTDGWSSAVISNRNYPTLQETNGAMKVATYQTAYLMQKGIPEWDIQTTYYANTSFCQVNGVVYKSLTDNNIGNNPTTSTSNWEVWNPAEANYANVDLSNLSEAGEAKFDAKLDENQVTNCILTSNNPSITKTDNTSVSYVNKGCNISGTTVTGFSADNTILLSKTMTTENEFTLEIPFVMSSAAGTQTLCYMNNKDNAVKIINGKISLVYDGNIMSGTTDLAASTSYTVKLTRTASNYTLQIKQGAGEYTDAEVTLTSTLNYYGGKSIYLGGGDDNYFSGSIDLSGVVITSAGGAYWSVDTTSTFQTVNISGTFQVLMPDSRNTDLTLKNVNQSITLNEALLYQPVNGSKTILVTQDNDLLTTDYYEENYNEPADTPLNGIWFDKSTSIMKQQLTTYPNLIINGATLTEGVISNFAQNQYVELPQSYTLGSAWSMNLSVNIEANSTSQTNVILGNMTAADEDAEYPYLPDGIGIVYDGVETVTAYLRREDVYVVNKTEVVSTAYVVTKTVSEISTTGYTSVAGDAETYVTAETQIYSDALMTIPLETAAADTWQYTGETEQNIQDITGYVREAGTTLVSSGVTVYSDANLKTFEGAASGSDWVYTGDTAPSLIGALTQTVSAGAATLALSFNGTQYALGENTLASTDTIMSNVNFYLGAAPSLTNGFFNSTINLNTSTFSFYTWNGESSSAQQWVSFVGCRLGKITDDGTNITSLALDYPLCLAKDYDVVHNTGDEEINGVKTFNETTRWEMSDTFVQRFQANNIEIGQVPSSNQYKSIQFADKNGKAIGILQCRYDTNGATQLALMLNNLKSPGTSAGLYTYQLPDGTSYSTTTTPTANNNSTRIATTAFVKDCFTNSRSNFITFSKSGNGYIKFSNGVCLQWGSFAVPNTRQYEDITFPISFSNTSYKLVCLDYNTTATTESSTNTNMSEASKYRKISGTRMAFQNQNIGAVEYIVIGY